MKTILITGASGGIGLSISKTLATNNNRLILIYNKHKKEISTLQKQCKNAEIIIFQCDLTNETAVKALVEEIIKKYKRIDCLVNCAGVSTYSQIQDIKEKDYNFIFDNNLKSVFNITSKVSKYMIKEQFGRIVNISSMWGVVGASMESLYSASKAAINNLTLSLAKELGPSNITINSVCPGLIDTKMNACLSVDTIKDIVNETPLQRIGTPQDVANLVEFLLSDKASYITGQIITVDGGLSL